MVARLIWVAFLMTALAATARGDVEFELERRQMIQAIKNDVISTSRMIGKNRLDAAVFGVMGRLPRHEFVPPSQQRHAYENRPLAIGYGQTISQPYIVALMTDILDLEPSDTVLEIGTGSAYQAAVLGELVERVFTIEIIPELGKQARQRLHRLGYGNVEVRIADGYYGWEEHAPFDAILVAAATSQVPPPLIRQLKPGGKMIIPVGAPFSVQHLLLISKEAEGAVRSRQVLPVAFVPLTGGH